MRRDTETPFETDLRGRMGARASAVRPSADAWEAIDARTRRSDRARAFAVPAVVVTSLVALVAGGLVFLRPATVTPRVAGVAAGGGGAPAEAPAAADPSQEPDPDPSPTTEPANTEPGICDAPRDEIVGYPRAHEPQPGEHATDPCPAIEHGFDTRALARSVGPWDDPLYARYPSPWDSRRIVDDLFDAPDVLCVWAHEVAYDVRGELDRPFQRLHAEVNRHLSVASDGLPMIVAEACEVPLD